MIYKLVGITSGIGAAAHVMMTERGHTLVDTENYLGQTDVLIFCAGHDWEVCVEELIRHISDMKAESYVVVTSEHGDKPCGIAYIRYAAMKAGQKMICRTLAHMGIDCVDVSPAFVIDSGKSKRYNTDEEYRSEVQREMRGIPPVTSADVAAAIVFASENIGKITGTTIRVSAGWRA